MLKTKDEWSKVRGVVIDVSKSDAKILEEQKLAKIVEVSNNDEQLEK